MRIRIHAMALMAVIALTGVSARADFTPIAQPTVGYTSSTTLINIAAIPDGTSGITSITDGVQTLSFDQSMTKTTVGAGWATWGSPPNTESNTPPVLFQTTSTTLEILLSLPSTTFGFELQGNNFAVNTFDVQFFQGVSLVGSIPLAVDGSGGARLFAASTTTNPFTRVLITNSDGAANGFAIAQPRYAAVPEPASVAMIAQAIAAVGFYGWRKRRQAARNV